MPIEPVSVFPGEHKIVNILFATSEVVPFAKTGGLADVGNALPIELARMGVDVSVFVPAYRCALNAGQTIEVTSHHFDIPIGGKIVSGRLLRSHLPGSAVPVYLIDQPDYFDRPELYRERGEDYKDNCERFVFFCRAVMESIRLLDLQVDILHCNDWQTSLIPAYLQVEYRHARRFEHVSSVMTIHNMAYQGHFWHWDMLLTGLDWRYYNWHQMEFYGGLNLLKTGLVFADMITTVSPRYAEEIQSDPHGCGLEGVLRQRADDLHGIINGVDYDVWNPATDPLIAAQYDPANWRQGKTQCKSALQKELGLPQFERTPLIGMIGRMADQKGWDLVAEVMKEWGIREAVQWAILGSGEPGYQQLISRLAGQHPERIAARLEFSDQLAHRIEAGADLFLMPSRYEPCGLNQLYSLKYGTVPLVRATGGLADTIVDLESGMETANGFRFENYSAIELERTLARACDVYRTQSDTWKRLVENGMRQDWSWTASARKYVELYQRALSARKTGALLAAR